MQKMKISVVSLIVGCVALSVLAADAPAPDFRKVTWGMTRDEVIAIEGEPPADLTADDSIGYPVKVMSLDMLLLYSFLDDTLVKSAYALVETHSNQNTYLDDYAAIKTALTEKYGEPTADQQNFKDELYRDRKDKWGQGVSMGAMTYRTTWQTDRTDIITFMSGDNYKISLSIFYTSRDPAHVKLIEDQKAKEKSADL